MNKIPDDIRIKVSQTISKIEKGEFSENDIESMLTKIRDYCPKDSIVKEIANFTTHHNRNSGRTFDSLYKEYCMYRAVVKYNLLKEKIDPTKYLDKWIFDALIYQIERIDSKKLYEATKLSRKQAINRIKKFISQSKHGYKIQIDKLKELSFLINCAFSFVKVKDPIYKSSTIIVDFIKVLAQNGFQVDQNKIYQYSDLIVLSIMLLMHKRQYYIDKSVIGDTMISMSNNTSGDLQYLILKGIIHLPEGPHFNIALIETDIERGNLISEDLIIIDEGSEKGHCKTMFDVKANLTLNNSNGKYQLCRLLSA